MANKKTTANIEPTMPLTSLQIAEGKEYAKTVQMVVGVDLLASKMSLSSTRGNVLEVTTLGIKAFSKSTGRIVLIPWTNVKGCELLK